MRSAYKSPVIWMTVVIGIAFAILGQVLTTTIQSDWKYLFFNLKPGGIIIAVFFTLCGLANFIGTRFVVDKEFTRSWPSMIVIIAAFAAILSLFITLLLGIENKFGVAVLFIGAGGVILSVPAAFFIRGMAPPSKNDR